MARTRLNESRHTPGALSPTAHSALFGAAMPESAAYLLRNVADGLCACHVPLAPGDSLPAASCRSSAIWKRPRSSCSS